MKAPPTWQRQAGDVGIFFFFFISRTEIQDFTICLGPVSRARPSGGWGWLEVGEVQEFKLDGPSNGRG